MTLLHMSSEVILPSESLCTVLAEEVLSPRVHHHVSPDVLPGVEPALAVLALVLFLLHARGGLARVRLQVLQEHARAFKSLQTHLAGEVAAGGSVQGQVPLEAELGVVALAALLAFEGLFVGVVGVEVILQVVFAVKHFLTIITLVGFLRRVSSHVPLNIDRFCEWIS